MLVLGSLKVLVFSSVVLAEPVFNSVNLKQVDGNFCPAVIQTGDLCPALCVSDYTLCPSNFTNTSCPSGTTLCIDGSCSSSCSTSLVNPCLCGYRDPPAASLSLFPCRLFDSITVAYDRSNRKQILAECERKFNVANNTKVWGEFDSEVSNSAFWSGKFCPTQPAATFTYKEPIWIGVFSVVGTQFLIIVIWWLYKLYSEQSIRKLRKNIVESTTFENEKNSPIYSTRTTDYNEKDTKGTTEKGNATNQGNEPAEGSSNLNIRGYNNSLFGTVGFYSVITFTIGWFGLLMVMVLDYYGEIGTFGHLAYGDFSLLNKTNIYVWCFATAWVFTMRVLLNRIRNFFRLEVLSTDSRFIQIEYKSQTLILSSSEQSTIFRYIKIAEDNFKKTFGLDSIVTTCPVLVTSKNIKYFEYQCTRYVLNSDTQTFEPYTFNLGETNEMIRGSVSGLSSEEAQFRLELVGFNIIQVFIPNFLVSLAIEFTNLFYLYQFLILWLYYYLSYWIIGVIDTAIIILSALTKVIVRRKSDMDVKKMAEIETFIDVLRDGRWTNISSKNMVPGDIYRVDSCKIIPCDSVVLGGNIVIDESSLTGEPLPVRKFALPDDSNGFVPMTHKPSSLFAGTIVSQATVLGGADPELAEPIALCLTTGTQTDRGKLIQKILFPINVSFILNEQLRVVFAILALYAIFVFILGVWFLRASITAAWYYCMFSVSQLINPLLPASLIVGQSVAASRLRKKQINCIDLSRIMMAGKVQVFCFDKTGTLTKENLEMFGVYAMNSVDDSSTKNQESGSPESSEGAKPKFTTFQSNVTELHDLYKMAIATCHSTTRIDDGRLIGNPVDIEMFKASKFEIQSIPNKGAIDTISSPDGSASFDVVKRFEFVHARASMSNAVLDPKTGSVHVFVKGSFERLVDYFDTSSIPEGYLKTCNKMAREGGYVLALGHRELGKVDVSTLADQTRDELETGCKLIGLIVFKNMLKEDTAQVITSLKKGDIRTIMITGDTALTGVFIARQCNMIPENDGVLLADVNHKGEVFWVDVDSEQLVSEEFVDSVGISWDKRTHEEENRAVAAPTLEYKRWELAMTGKAFGVFIRNGLIDKYLLNTRVFARMLPNEKVECVTLHMNYTTTAMCGDGGNDCGALRVAHAGLALSEADASIVSPFSSKCRSISTCEELIIQGRAAMATSLASYRFLIQFGQSVTLIKIFTFYFSVGLNQNVWIMVDAFIGVGMAFAVSLNKPAKKISSRRPTSQILGPQVLFGTIGIVFINFLFLAGGFIWLYSKSWFRCNEFEAGLVDISKWWLLGDNYETEVIAFIGLMQLVTSAFVVNFGYLFRRRWYTNVILVFFWVSFIAILSYMLMADPNWLGCKMRFNCGTPSVLQSIGYPMPSFKIDAYNMPLGHNVFPKSARYQLLLIAYANVIAIILWETLVILGPVRNYIARRLPLKRLKLTL